jgi:hypothetical protein
MALTTPLVRILRIDAAMGICTGRGRARTPSRALAEQQHSDEKFGIDRKPAGRTVKWRHVAPDVRQFNKAVD